MLSAKICIPVQPAAWPFPTLTGGENAVDFTPLPSPSRLNNGFMCNGTSKTQLNTSQINYKVKKLRFLKINQ